jgi:hypothetical protein
VRDYDDNYDQLGNNGEFADHDDTFDRRGAEDDNRSATRTDHTSLHTGSGDTGDDDGHGRADYERARGTDRGVGAEEAGAQRHPRPHRHVTAPSRRYRLRGIRTRFHGAVAPGLPA